MQGARQDGAKGLAVGCGTGIAGPGQGWSMLVGHFVSFRVLDQVQQSLKFLEKSMGNENSVPLRLQEAVYSFLLQPLENLLLYSLVNLVQLSHV